MAAIGHLEFSEIALFNSLAASQVWHLGLLALIFVHEDGVIGRDSHVAG